MSITKWLHFYIKMLLYLIVFGRLFLESMDVTIDSALTNSSFDAKLKSKRKAINPVNVPYQPWENVIHPASTLFSDFTKLPHEVIRNKIHIRANVLNSLKVCNTDVGAESAAHAACNDIWGDKLILAWRNRKVKDLCEENGKSKINCYDSLSKSRFCVFENAMMNFKKVRKRKQDGSVTRSWERGFFSADCGEMAKDDIGYMPLYKPDIERINDEEPMCDYIFNETVLVYSHENIRNFGQTVSDYMNVWSMLWIAGISQEMKDISLFNIDALKKGSFFNDQPNQFFKTYDVSFRRVLKASEFAESGARVCFKRLLLQPRPVVQFTWDGVLEEMKCSYMGPSAIFQRWNLQVRHNYEILGSPATMPTNDRIQILLVTRSDRPGVTEHITSRLFANTDAIIDALSTYVSTKSSLIRRMEFVVSDIAKLSFDAQVMLIANSSIVVGMHGAGIASSIHMAIGTRHCCGVIEIFPEGEFKARGYGNLARRMGHTYARIDVPGNNTSLTGTVVEPDFIVGALDQLLQSIARESSCFLPAVLNAPFL